MPTLYNKFDFNDIVIEEPTKNNDDNVYISNVQNINLQTNKLDIYENDKKLKLKLNESFKNFLLSLDEKIIETLSHNSKSWFNEEFSTEEMEDFYKGSIKTIKKTNLEFISLYIDENISIYDNQKSLLNIEDLSKNNQIISVIKLDKIIYDKTSCIPYWTVTQIKLKKVNNLPLDKCLITEDKINNIVNNENAQRKLFFY
jgi:hypothetical protein